MVTPDGPQTQAALYLLKVTQNGAVTNSTSVLLFET
jgi:hypothetical protein